MSMTVRLTRDVTRDECHWLHRDFTEGEILHEKTAYGYGCCSEDGTSMSENGKFFGFEIPNDAFEKVEDVVPDFNKCGGGREAECCIFLTVGPRGFCCERYGPAHPTLVERREQMHAKRTPTENYPSCMKFDNENL